MCDCNRALELLSLRLDGPLSPAEEEALSEHLASCPDCGAAAQALENIHAALPGLLEEPPHGFHQRVMARIAAEQVIPFPAPHSKKRVWKTWLSTAAVFALIILGGSGLLRSGLLGNPTTAGAPAGTPALYSTPAENGMDGAMPQQSSEDEAAAVDNLAEDAPVPTAQGKSIPAQTPAQTPAPVPNQAPAPMPTDIATPAPMLREEPAGPAAVQFRMATPEEAAARQLGETQWPGAEVTLLYNPEGGLTGVQVVREEGTLTLICLGTTANGLYCEFQPDGQESDRFAVALDGTGILTRQSDAPAYDAAVSES